MVQSPDLDSDPGPDPDPIPIEIWIPTRTKIHIPTPDLGPESGPRSILDADPDPHPDPNSRYLTIFWYVDICTSLDKKGSK